MTILKHTITRGRILTPDGGIIEESVTLEDGCIASVGTTGGLDVPAGGLLVLPGIIDLHGDAFEHVVMPRPSAKLPYDLALAEADRQMVSNGITTAYLGVSYTWEPGLRGSAGTKELLKAIEAGRSGLAVDARIHLRFEIYHLEGMDTLMGWVTDRWLDMLSFNDHAEYQARKITDPATMAVYSHRSGLSAQAFYDLFREKTNRREAAYQGVKELAAAGAAAGLPMASHDEDSPRLRAWYHHLGCRICEFPINRETAEAARDMGDPVVLGGPNVLKGGSLYQRLSARACIAEGLCHILTSDYYYPSQLNAAFLLAESGICTFGDAWNLIAAEPARVAGLHDRGNIVAGKRADLILVDDAVPLRPKVAAVFAAGRLVYADRSFIGE